MKIIQRSPEQQMRYDLAVAQADLTAAQKALAVIVCTPAIRAFLLANDPKALQQCGASVPIGILTDAQVDSIVESRKAERAAGLITAA